jgi:hypothetical protein
VNKKRLLSALLVLLVAFGVVYAQTRLRRYNGEVSINQSGGIAITPAPGQSATVGGTLIANTASIVEGRLSSTAAVNLNVTTKTTLYTVPAGKSAVITRMVIRNASTSLTTASCGIGFDASGADVVASETWVELTGATLYTVRLAKDGSKVGAAADVLGLKCSIAQGGAATATVDVFGYLY